MEANELRIGNLFFIMNRHGAVHMPGQTLFKILTIGFDAVEVIDARLHPAEQETWHKILIYDLIPIPLTEERLEKFGFEKDVSDIHYLYKYGVYSVRSVGGGMHFFEILNQKLLLIKSVHQLQNLYFALSSAELKVQEKVSSN